MRWWWPSLLWKSPDGETCCTLRDYVRWYVWPRIWPWVSRKRLNAVQQLNSAAWAEVYRLRRELDALSNRLEYRIRTDEEIAAELTKGKPS